MAKPLIVIITRMHAVKDALKGISSDEYVAIWLRDAEEEFAYFMLPTCGVLIVHGHRMRYKLVSYKKDANNQIQEAIKDSALRLDQYDELYVLYHATDNVSLSPEDVAPAFGGRTVKAAKYSSLPTESKMGPWVKGALKQLGFTDDLIGEVESCRSSSPEEIRKRAHSVLPVASGKAFSHLKHQIGHLFLSLSIDIQGMESVEGAERLAYAKEILKERSDNRYSFKQRLSNLRFLVAKVDDGNEKTLSGDALPDNASVWDWLVAFDLDGSETSKNLLVLSGLALSENGPVTDQNNGLVFYFNSLDRATVAEALMPAMKSSFKMYLWNNGQSKEEELGLEKWLEKLDSVLDELRSTFIKLGEERQEVAQNAG
jgi:hypothetical protein